MADRSVSIALEAKVSGFVAGMKTAQRSVSGFQAELEKSAKQRQALSDLGGVAGKIGLAAAAGLGAAVVASANFDQAMSKVQAATHETAGNMELLRTAALKAGEDTAFSATEAAAGIENLSKAGVATKDILGGGLSGALSLAAAGEIEVADAAEIAATAMTQFGLSGESVPHVADLLAAAAGKAQGEVSDFGMALNQSGLVASQMGLSIEETTGSLAAFAAAGLQGSDAGTSFKSMLLRLANPSREAAAAMEKFGISAYDAQGNMVSMSDLAGQVATGFEGQSQATRDAALATIFGSDAIRAANVLYNEGAAGIDAWTARVDDSGYAAETAATKLDNLKGDLEALGGALETALIGTGEGAQGPLRSLVQGVTDVVNAYNSLPQAAQTATASILGLTAAVGGGLWASGKIVTGIADTKAALDALSISGGKVAGALAAAAKAGAAMGGAVIAVSVLDSWDDAAMSAREMELALSGLAAGEVNAALSNLSGTANTLGEALKQAAFNDLHFMDAADEVEALDAALANLADTDPGAAADAFKTIEAQAKAAGLTVDELAGIFPEYNNALKIAAQEEKAAADAAAELTGATKDNTGATQANTGAQRANAKALTETREARLRNANAEINYQQALDDSRQSLKENGKTLDITTDKGRNNRRALLGQIEAWNSQSKATRNSGDAQRSAIREFVRTAGQMGMNSDKARDYAKRLMDIPPKRETKVEAKTEQAQSSVNAVISRLALVRDKSVTLTVNERTIRTTINNVVRGSTPSFLRAPVLKASGGYVTGPGTATSDSIPARLSNGEYVIRAAAVQQYGVDMMHTINAQRFANGGAVGRGGGRDRDGDRNHRDAQDSRKKQLAELQKMVAATKDLQSTVEQKFRVDPFEANATLGGVLRSLEADTTSAREFATAARQAKRAGLSGGVFRSLLASGNTAVLSDVDTRREVQQIERAWRARNQATASLTFGAASTGRYEGDSLRELKQEIRRLRHATRRMGRDVRDGARDGTREGTQRDQRRRKTVTSRGGLP